MVLYEELFKKAKENKYVFISDGNTRIGHVSKICAITKYSVIAVHGNNKYEDLARKTSDVTFLENCPFKNLQELKIGDNIVVETDNEIFATVFSGMVNDRVVLNRFMHFPSEIKRIYLIDSN